MPFGYRMLGFGGGALKTFEPYSLQYLIVAGGAGGDGNGGAGGGAGGYRCVACKSFPVTWKTSYPITVGGGGAAGSINSGESSVFSTITSTFGGGETDTIPVEVECLEDQAVAQVLDQWVQVLVLEE